jgi:NAD+ kinase
MPLQVVVLFIYLFQFSEVDYVNKMNKEIKKVLVISNKKQEAEPVLAEIKAYFKQKRIKLVWYAFEGDFPYEDLEGVDLAISLGGDGTLLFCSGLVAPRNIPILAVNLGYLGFITEIAKDEWVEAYEEYISGRMGISERIMVKVAIQRDGQHINSFYGLNDVVIGNVGISKLVQLKLYVSNCYAGRYRADGVIVATSTGSTAYSMGAGGPIIHPEMDAFILNPICPFTLSNRPLVIPGHETIEIEVEENQRAHVVLSVDGKEEFPLLAGDRVRCERYEHKCLIICSNKRNFYEVLKAKLNWSGEPTNA